MRVQPSDVMAYTERWEGRRPHVYTDTRGHLTIGVGFNLDRADARARIGALGVNYEDLRSGALDLTDDQITKLLEQDVSEAIDAASDSVNNLADLPRAKQIVLVDMAFNLGAAGLRGFRKMIEAIQEERWEDAAVEMENSTWYSQVGKRARVGIATIKQN